MRAPRAVDVFGVNTSLDSGEGSSYLVGSNTEIDLRALFSLIVSLRMFFYMASNSLTANAVLM